MNDIKFDAVVGKLEDVGVTEACVEFSQWHSNQGVDLTFYGDIDDIKRISLSKDELHCIAVLSIASGFIDFSAAEKEAKELISISEKRKDFISKSKDKMVGAGPMTFGYNDVGLLEEDLELSFLEEIKKDQVSKDSPL
jgi:hypothetical protein